MSRSGGHSAGSVVGIEPALLSLARVRGLVPHYRRTAGPAGAAAAKFLTRRPVSTEGSANLLGCASYMPQRSSLLAVVAGASSPNWAGSYAAELASSTFQRCTPAAAAQMCGERGSRDTLPNDCAGVPEQESIDVTGASCAAAALKYLLHATQKMAARRGLALLAQRLARPAGATATSAYNPAPLAAALAARNYRHAAACPAINPCHPSTRSACDSCITACATLHCTLDPVPRSNRPPELVHSCPARCPCCSALPLPSDPSEHIQPQFSNAAAVLHGINDLRYEEAPPLPETVAPGAVRVGIKAVGICRSDVHYLQKVRSDALTFHLTACEA